VRTGRAVVALESTVLAHGLPRGDNRETADRIEDRVRAAGAVPATVAVLDGTVRIGLSASELDRLCGDDGIAKLSVRDVGVAVALGVSGATTGASTSALAHVAGIEVLATGGLGGVHRGAAQSFDISADLGVLGRTPVLVVCAGVKSILDMPATLEYLETLSVPVIGYRTDAFPGFYLSDGLAALRRAMAMGRTTSVDPQAASHLAAAGAGNFLSWVSGVDLLLPNDSELEALGGTTAALHAARNAGLLASWLRGDRPQAALRQDVAAGSGGRTSGRAAEGRRAPDGLTTARRPPLTDQDRRRRSRCHAAGPGRPRIQERAGRVRS
jgi:hypothetical protein